jgi:alkaline phosphatase D
MRQVAALRPDLMLWLGDNTYLRDGDWTTRTGILHRWSHTRADPHLQPLLASAANFGTWDDHEYGPNDADRSYRDKHLTREAFDLFLPQPRNGAAHEGLYTSMEFGDVSFFLLDDRWFRSPNTRRTGQRVYWGETQLEWLIDALRSSRATFKIVVNGGQVLNPLAVYENASTFPSDRQQLLDRLAAERIPGVLFVSGDRHHTELTRLDRPMLYPLFDFTVSPLTAGLNSGTEDNVLRVPDTLVREHNFGIIDVTGSGDTRQLTLRIHDGAGTQRWTHTIRATDLQP